MITRRTGYGIVATLAVAGAAAGVTVLATGSAQAMPTDFECTSGQVSATLVPGDAGMGNRGGYVQFTANPGESCTLPGSLPAELTGARDVLLAPDAPADAPPVQLSDGSSAYVQLHWTGIEAAADQETPLAITMTAPQTVDPRGVESDPAITLDWTLGPVDATPQNHTIDVGAVTPGTAPQPY